MNTNETDQKILDGIKALGASQQTLFDPQVLNFSQDIRGMCEQNTCGSYNKNWACPPASGTMEELRDLCLGFKKGVLFNYVTHLTDSFDWEGMMAGALEHKELTAKAYDFIKGFDLARFQVFGGGGCNTCETCTWPGAACRFPEKLFLPIEGCGTNVSQLAKDVGLNYHHGQNTVTYFSMILYD